MSKPLEHAPTSNEAYNAILNTLLTHPDFGTFYSPATSPHALLIPQPQTTSSKSSPSAAPKPPTISSLTLHPTLESLLHLLNLDLPSAHFLLRHSQAPPQWESMYLHGILHRIEGDIDNARAWYGDVEESAVFKEVWRAEDGPGGVVGLNGKGEQGGKEKWKVFLDRMERWRDQIRSRNGSKGTRQSDGNRSSTVEAGIDWQKEELVLRDLSQRELITVLDFCQRKFGVGEVNDASVVYSMNGDKAEIGAQMVTGGEGWREF